MHEIRAIQHYIAPMLRQGGTLRLAFILSLMVSACALKSGEGPVAVLSLPSATCEGQTQPQTPAVTRLFEDATESVGLALPQWNGIDFDKSPSSGAEFDRQVRESIGVLSGGAAIADVDGDGYDDIYLPRVGLPNALMQSRCGLEFDDVGASAGVDAMGADGGALWFDIDGDGDLDLFAGSLTDSTDLLYVNQGDGTFAEEGAQRGIAASTVPDGPNYTFSAMAYDPDQDGDLDLFLGRWQQGPMVNFGAAPPRLSDGHSAILENDGNGNFREITLETGIDTSHMAIFSPVWGDLNGDGRLDLALTSDFRTSALLLVADDSAYEDVTDVNGVGTDEAGMGAIVADLDGDLDLDWFVTSIACGDSTGPGVSGCSGNRFYVNDGSGAFEDATDLAGLRDGGWGWGAVAQDFDLDGDLDLAMTNGILASALTAETPPEWSIWATDASRYWRRDGHRWVEVSDSVGFADTREGKGLFYSDLDRDGDVDLLEVNTRDGLTYHRNTGVTDAAWLQIELSNHPSSAGAAVFVTAGTHVQRRDVQLGTFQGQSASAVLFFGFGVGEPPRELSMRIDWANGSSDEFSGLEPGNRYRIDPP